MLGPWRLKQLLYHESHVNGFESVSLPNKKHGASVKLTTASRLAYQVYDGNLGLYETRTTSAIRRELWLLVHKILMSCWGSYIAL